LEERWSAAESVMVKTFGPGATSARRPWCELSSEAVGAAISWTVLEWNISHFGADPPIQQNVDDIVIPLPLPRRQRLLDVLGADALATRSGLPEVRQRRGCHSLEAAPASLAVPVRRAVPRRTGNGNRRYAFADAVVVSCDSPARHHARALICGVGPATARSAEDRVVDEAPDTPDAGRPWSPRARDRRGRRGIWGQKLQLLAAHPDLTRTDVQACLAYAQAMVTGEERRAQKLRERSLETPADEVTPEYLASLRQEAKARAGARSATPTLVTPRAVGKPLR
jgi:hypothetical protein